MDTKAIEAALAYLGGADVDREEAWRLKREAIVELKAAEAKRKEEARLYTVRRIGDEVHVDLLYPRSDGHPKHVVVNISDVRACDGVRLSYDFAEDGFRVEQPTARMEFVPSGGALGGHLQQVDTWTRVFFAQAWALELSDEEKKANEEAAFSRFDQHAAALKGKP